MGATMPGAAGIQPQLYAADGRAAVDFYIRAFGAVQLHRVNGTDEHPPVVAQLAIGEHSFWVSDEMAELDRFSPVTAGHSTVKFILIDDDPAALARRAVDAGATLLHEVSEGHGWEIAAVRDPYGYQWEIGRPIVPWPPIK
jgi:PhnB protein